MGAPKPMARDVFGLGDRQHDREVLGVQLMLRCMPLEWCLDTNPAGLDDRQFFGA